MLALAVAMLISSTPAGSPMQCGPFAAVLETLHMKYHERPVWGGMSQRGTSMMMTASPEGTWTLLALTVHEGAPAACMLAAGDKSQQFPAPVGTGS